MPSSSASWCWRVGKGGQKMGLAEATTKLHRARDQPAFFLLSPSPETYFQNRVGRWWIRCLLPFLPTDTNSFCHFHSVHGLLRVFFFLLFVFVLDVQPAHLSSFHHEQQQQQLKRERGSQRKNEFRLKILSYHSHLSSGPRLPQVAH